ncbi:MAG: DnaJ C-terminal domain-containing protein [Kibdelosporangium sp.]
MQQTEMAEEVTRIARTVAAAIAPGLESRLIDVYGQDWLAAITSRHRAERRHKAYRRRLSDHRFCLTVFARDPATSGWRPEHLRQKAWQLVTLANAAVHDDLLTEDQVLQARDIRRSFRHDHDTRKSAAGPPPPRPVPDPPVVEAGRDVYHDLTLSADEVETGRHYPVHVLRHSSGSWVRKKVNVRIPPNFPGGKKIRVTGGGSPGPDGTPPGDLYINVIRGDRFHSGSNRARQPEDRTDRSSEAGATVAVKATSGPPPRDALMDYWRLALGLAIAMVAGITAIDNFGIAVVLVAPTVVIGAVIAHRRSMRR